MKIFQLNIWLGALIEPILTVIERENPDIICMQEVSSSPSGDTLPSVANLQKLQKFLPDYYMHYSPYWDSQVEGMAVQFGTTIFTRYPMTNTHDFFTRGTYQENFRRRDMDENIRTLQHVTVDTPDGDIHVLNHHGIFVWGPKIGNDETTQQMTIIADYIDTLYGQVVLCGDFNLNPDSVSLIPLHNQLRNLCCDYDVKTTRNYLCFHPIEICDYIFTSPDITVKEFTVLDDLVSDHAALIATI